MIKNTKQEESILINKVTTKSGDKGKSLMFGKMKDKNDIIFDLIGNLDLLNAHIGCIRNFLLHEKDFFISIQNDLFDIGRIIYCKTDLQDECINKLENFVGKYNADLPPLTSFVLPNTYTADIHIARAVTRNTERIFWMTKCQYEFLSDNIGVYLNRMSDVLFVMARICDQDEQVWERSKNSVNITEGACIDAGQKNTNEFGSK